MESARAGDADAFEALYARYRAPIYTFLRYLCRDPETAADLAQEVWIRAWDSLPELREAGAFRAWLHRIAANAARDRAKARRRRPAQVSLEAAADRADPEAEDAADAIAADDARRRVRTAIAALPEIHRQVIVMHHLEEMPVEEIARSIGIRRGTVLSRLARAREALRRQLAPQQEMPRQEGERDEPRV